MQQFLSVTSKRIAITISIDHLDNERSRIQVSDNLYCSVTTFIVIWQHQKHIKRLKEYFYPIDKVTIGWY